MSDGYMIVNGQRVEGRTLSFDDNGVQVNGVPVIECDKEEKENVEELKEEKVQKNKNNTMLKVISLMCVICVICGGCLIYKGVKKYGKI